MRFPPCPEFGLQCSRWCHGFTCKHTHHLILSIRVSQRSASLHQPIGCHWTERAKATILFSSHVLYSVFPFGKNNNCEKGGKEGKSSDCRLVFRQVNSSKRYTGNLRSWIFILLKKFVSYSSTRWEGTGEGERQSENMLIFFWKGPWESFATNPWVWNSQLVAIQTESTAHCT